MNTAQKENIVVRNLKCQGCASTIQMSLQAIDGVDMVEVDVQESKVTIIYDNPCSRDQLTDHLSDLGYPETGNSVLLKAKSFVSCAVGRMSD